MVEMGMASIALIDWKTGYDDSICSDMSTSCLTVVYSADGRADSKREIPPFHEEKTFNVKHQSIHQKLNGTLPTDP